METHLAAIFPNSTNIPSPLKAAFSSFTPPKVWFFGDEAPRHQVATYAYNTAAGTFTYTGMAAPGWHDVTVTSASMWPDNHSKAFQNFLYNGSKVAQVDANLAVRDTNSAVKCGWSLLRLETSFIAPFVLLQIS